MVKAVIESTTSGESLIQARTTSIQAIVTEPTIQTTGCTTWMMHTGLAMHGVAAIIRVNAGIQPWSATNSNTVSRHPKMVARSTNTTKMVSTRKVVGRSADTSNVSPT
jgi:hypothetical protein